MKSPVDHGVCVTINLLSLHKSDLLSLHKDALHKSDFILFAGTEKTDSQCNAMQAEIHLSKPSECSRFRKVKVCLGWDHKMSISLEFNRLRLLNGC